MAVARELVRYKLDLVGVKVRWDKGGTAKRRGLYFVLWKRKQISSIGNSIFFVQHRTVSAVQRIKSVSDKMP